MDSAKCQRSNMSLIKSTGNPKQYQRKSKKGSIHENDSSVAKNNYQKTIQSVEKQPQIKIIDKLWQSMYLRNTFKSKTLTINEIIQNYFYGTLWDCIVQHSIIIMDVKVRDYEVQK